MEHQDPAQEERPVFEALLYPHRSLGRKGYAILIAGTAAICFLYGLVFLVIGAWPIFFFLGGEWLLFWFLWRFTPGMGYGDVRLSGLLGLALGYLGWSELVIGLYAGFVIGVVGWVFLRLFKVTKGRHFPFGPFMLVGAVVGVAWGPAIASSLGYGSG